MRGSYDRLDRRSPASRMPADQWQLRAPNPHNAAQQRPQCVPMAGSEGLFSARFQSPQQHNPFPTFSVQTNTQYSNYDNNYSNFNNSVDSSLQFTPRPQQPSPPFPLADTSRPVYCTRDSNITETINSLNDEVVNQLKSVLRNVNPHPMSAQSFASSESTVTSGDNRMDKLIAELRQLNEEDDRGKQERRDIDLKINGLNERLKPFEKEINERERLKKLRADMETQEEEISERRKKLVLEMDNCNKTQKRSINDSPIDQTFRPEVVNESTDGRSDREEIPIDVRRYESRNNETPKFYSCDRSRSYSYNTSHKRPQKTYRSSPKSNNYTKKVRLNREDNWRDRPSRESSRDSRSERHNRSPNRRTHIPSKQSPNDRNHRQKSPSTSTPNSVSGSTAKVSASTRGQKLLNSMQESQQVYRIPKITDTSNTTNTSESSLTHTNTRLEPTIGSTEADLFANPITEDNLDTEVSEQSVNNSKPNSNLISLTEYTNTLISPSNQSTNDVSKDVETNETQNNVEINEENVSELPQNNTSNETVVDKHIEVIDIDSGDEESVAQEDEETQEMTRIKTEPIDEIENPSLEPVLQPNMPTEADSHVSNESTDAMNSNANENSFSESNVSNNTSQTNDESVLRVQTFDRKQLKYTAFEPNVFGPTVEYNIKTLKRFGPNSKSAIVAFKAFQNYLFVSFVDYSVQRFNIDDRNKVLSFEGHNDIVVAMMVVKCPKSTDTFILYTGGKDKTLRAFNAITGRIFIDFELKAEIYCLDFGFNNVFAGLSDGTVCKIPLIHETSDGNKVKYFIIDSEAIVHAITVVKPVYPTDTIDIEPLIAVSKNKLKVINTSDSVKDERIFSKNFKFFFPINMRVFKNSLFISHKIQIKNEKTKKMEEFSKVLVFDLKKGWKPLDKRIEVKDGFISCLDLVNDKLIVSSSSGKIQCIDAIKLDCIWITYTHEESRLISCIMIGDRLVFGAANGHIDSIQLSQRTIECGDCGIDFVRQIDVEKHVNSEH